MSQIEPPPSGRPARKGALAFIFAAALMDVIALGITIPVLPRLIEGFTGNTAAAAGYIGAFGTLWALMQFFASPVLGALSDRFGRRPVLLLSIFGLGLDYVVMALAPTLAWLFVGRLISGITSASMSTAGAYIADVTPPERRAQAFGMMGAAFGIGFVVGPALGGLLGQYDPRLPFWVAAGLALANGAYGLFVLPESLPKARRSAFRWARANPLGSLKLLRAHPGLLGLSSTYFLYMLAHQVLNTTAVLYAGYRFGWDPRAMGAFLAVVGISSIIVQGGLVRPAVARLKERGVLILGFACGALGFLVYGTVGSGPMFYLGVPIFALSSLAQAGYQGLITQKVAPGEQGQLQGANAAISGLAGMIGPTLFSATFAFAIGAGRHLHIPGLAFYLAAALLVVALLLAERFSRPETTEDVLAQTT